MDIVLHHLFHLLVASWASLVASMGTTTLAIFVGLALVCAPFAIAYCNGGVAVMKANVTRNVLIGAFLWLALFAWNVARTIYLDHQQLVFITNDLKGQVSAQKQELALLSPTIFMECQTVSMSVVVPPHSTIHLIAINKKRMQTQNWGFFDISNDKDAETQWPEAKTFKDKIAALTKDSKINSGAFGYRCAVSNHGPENVIYLRVPIDFWFDSNTTALRYEPIVPSLDVGQSFSFYVFNDCPDMVSAAWQQTAVVQTPQEKIHEVKLLRKYVNPVDQIMMFFPSNIQWVGEQPCK